MKYRLSQKINRRVLTTDCTEYIEQHSRNQNQDGDLFTTESTEHTEKILKNLDNVPKVVDAFCLR